MPYFDNEKPTPDEIRAFTGDYIDAYQNGSADPDELWVALATDPVTGTEHSGAGRTAAEAKTCAWVHSHWPGGTGSIPVQVSTQVPDGWTFELHPPLRSGGDREQ